MFRVRHFGTYKRIANFNNTTQRGITTRLKRESRKGSKMPTFLATLAQVKTLSTDHKPAANLTAH